MKLVVEYWAKRFHSARVTNNYSEDFFRIFTCDYSSVEDFLNDLKNEVEDFIKDDNRVRNKSHSKIMVRLEDFIIPNPKNIRGIKDWKMFSYDKLHIFHPPSVQTLEDWFEEKKL